MKYPMNLFQAMERIRAWTMPENRGKLTYDLDQIQIDARHVLDRHDLLHQIGERREKAIWYQNGSEGNGNIDISWQERAEEMERKLIAAKSVLWMARRYAEAGGTQGPEMQTVRAALIALDMDDEDDTVIP